MADGEFIAGDGSGGGGGGSDRSGDTGGAGGTGGGNADSITGTAGDDVIFGDGSGGAGGGSNGTPGNGGAAGSGNDTIIGGDGNDILFGDGFNSSSAGVNGGVGGLGGGGGGGGVNYATGGGGGIGGGGGGGGDYGDGGDGGIGGGGGGGGASGGTGGSGGGLGATSGTTVAGDGTGGGGGGGYFGTGGTGSGFNVGGGTGGSGGSPGSGGNGGSTTGDYSGGGGGGGFGYAGTGGAGTSSGSGTGGNAGGSSQYTITDTGSVIYNDVKGEVDAGNIGTSTPGTTNGQGSGADVLDGGAGSDDYYGQGGGDTFIVDLNDNDAGNDTDRVHDFNRGAGDKIELENGASNILTTQQVDDILNNVGGAFGSTVVAGDTTITFANGSTLIIDDATDLTSADFVACFLTGTHIATPAGETFVETLQIGDPVLDVEGEAHRILWVGQRKVSTVFANRGLAYPVCVKAGALADGVPSRDLYLSPDHALYVGGILVHAEALVNGTSIVKIERMAEDFTYWHLELEQHALILAEGAPAESFVDAHARKRYDNWAEFETLYPNAPFVPELPYARATARRQLSPLLRITLDRRAELLGHLVKKAS